MLEYIKTILLKVSFDKMLFEKELRKGLKMLEREQLPQFRRWCYEMFSDSHPVALKRVFQINALTSGKSRFTFC
ncbi:hypothetical protein [Pontibacter harenae]|uniref:hypothetical protein n=1 Tax=Pontibacter harenae TaxID=2894083 RepID=UPI001E5D2D60|nr:hypothetical protein [Pontibacter harenae]MCC9169052.1 hypothetical protein [Pontibacter harenae]